MSWTVRIAFILLLVILLFSHIGCACCAEEPPCFCPPDILVEPQKATLKIGEKVSLTSWEAACIVGTPEEGPHCTKKRELKERVIWHSTNPSVSIIDSFGVASALAPGRTKIGASFDTRGLNTCLCTRMANMISAPPARLFIYERTDVSLGTGLEKAPWDVDIHPTKGIALVSLPMGDSVQEVILPSGGLSTALPLTAGSFPQGIAISPTSNRAVVANRFSDTVSIIDLTASPVVTSSLSLPPGSGPIAGAFSPTGGVAIVASYDTGRLSFIDVMAEPPQERAWVGVGPSPTGLAISPAGNAALVLRQENALTIVPLDTIGDVVTVSVSGESGLFGLAVDRTNGLAYLTHWGSLSTPGSSVSIMDLNVFPPELLATIKAEEGPFDVAIHEESGIAVVGNLGGAAPGTSISLIEKQKYPYYPYGTGFTITASIPVGKGPTGLAILSGTNLAVVANSGDNSLSLIRLPLP